MSTTTMRQKIKQKAIEIRNKRLGRDVREAMASGVELAGETAADAMDMSEATKTDWDKKSNDGSFVPSHEWSGTKLRFKNPNGTNGAYQDLQGPAGSIENATAKDIKLDDGRTLQQFVDNYLKGIHPIGTIISTYTNANPSVTFGGTWVAFSQGRTLVGVDTTQEEFKTIGKTGGEKTHKLVLSEMPSHDHEYDNGLALKVAKGIDYVVQDAAVMKSVTSLSGGDEPHNNLQPYITVYFWKRTA